MANETTQVHTTGGVGLTGLLTTAFVVLKLTGHIDWSWWWVLSPLWIGFGLFLVVLAAISLGFIIVYAIDARTRRGR